MPVPQFFMEGTFTMTRLTTFAHNTRSLLPCLLLMLIACSLNAQLNREDLSKSINAGQLQHPYLFFTDEDKPAILKRIQSDKESKDIMAGLMAEGHRFLNMPIRKEAPPAPRNPRYYVEDTEATRHVGQLRSGATTLAFLYQMTGELKYARKATEFAMAICDLTEWINPAHTFDIIYPRVWPWNVPDDQVVFSYDITSSGKAITLSTVYDWLYPVLTKQERDKIRGALLEKAITRVRGNYDFFWWSTSYRCNWSAICYSGLGITSLALLKEHPQILDVAAESYNRLNLTFDQIDEDGGWQEGRGYYGYMMRESVLFMDALKRLTNGKYNLFHHKKVRNHPLDFVLYTLTANFEDSGGGPVGGSMVNKLVEESGNATGAWYRQTFVDEGSDLFDILWPRSKIKPVEPEQKSKHFRTIDWAVMRSDFLDPSTVTIATKAGLHDDPHHGHLDCGQFILTWQGVPFIRDIGRMRYDEYYFNEDRWVYPFASSAGHNLIFVNGEQQIPAKLKDQPWKEGIGGRILKFQTGAKRDYVLMDPTKAYPGKELKKWRRSIILEKPVVTVVLDEVESAVGASIEARFFPGLGPPAASIEREPGFPRRPSVEYKVAADHVLLSSQQHHMALVPLVLGNNFTIIDEKIPTIPVMEGARLEWLPYVGTVTKATSTSTIIVTIVVPVANREEAGKLVQNAKVSRLNASELEVTMTGSAGNFRWTFEKEKDGFVLRNP